MRDAEPAPAPAGASPGGCKRYRASMELVATGCGLGVNGRMRQRYLGSSVDTVLSLENTGRRADSIAHGVMPWPHPRTFSRAGRTPSPLTRRESARLPEPLSAGSLPMLPRRIEDCSRRHDRGMDRLSATAGESPSLHRCLRAQLLEPVQNEVDWMTAGNASRQTDCSTKNRRPRHGTRSRRPINVSLPFGAVVNAASGLSGTS